jgi:hypothetical protein
MMDRRQVMSAIVPLGTRIAVVLAASMAFAYVWQLSPADLRPAARVQVAAPGASGVTLEDEVRELTAAAHPAIGERPLFYASRSRWTPPPPPPAPPPVERAPPPLTSYMLAGVIVSGNARTALIKPQNGRGAAIVLAVGQQLDGWTLQQIDETKLLFNAGKSTYEMKLPKPSEIGR